MNDTTDLWRAVHAEMAERRAARRSEGADAILALRARGWDVKQITDCQFRVDGVLDLYPTNRRWHHLTTGRRGGYGRESVDQLLTRLLKATL